MAGGQLQFVNLDNFEQLEAEGKIVGGVKIGKIFMARRGDTDNRGYLVQFMHPDFTEFYNPGYPTPQEYYSFTYKGIARDEDQWHVHPRLDQPDGLSQIDRWNFIGKAVAAVGDPKTGMLNLFQMGFGWGEKGGFQLFIPSRVYHGFLSVGGIIDHEGKEGAYIINIPDKPYNKEHPELVEGRVPFTGSKILLPSGNEFNWEEVRAELGITS